MTKIQKSLMGSLAGTAVALCLLAAAALPASAQQPAMPAQSQSLTKTVTKTGCLSKSAGGSFQLASPQATIALTAAPGVTLASGVGHTVTVKGAMSSSATGAQQLNVTTIKVDSATCGAGL